MPGRLLLAALVLTLATVARAQPVDLALVLAVDVSESVDAERYNLQIGASPARSSSPASRRRSAPASTARSRSS
jgi:hypothetical protein